VNENKETEVFFSYARFDNAPYSKRAETWVTKTVTYIKQRSGSSLGRELLVFFDTESLQDGPVQQSILESAKTSCIFVAFVSPAYFNSNWTIEEVQARIAHAGCKRILLIAIEKYQYSISEYISKGRQQDIQNILECLLQLKVGRFFDGNSRFGTQALKNKNIIYYKKIDDIAATIVELVKTCQEQLGKPRRNTVYLSIVPSSLATQRQAIANELKGYKISFAPLDNLTLDLPQVDAQARFEFFSAGCKLFVLLLDKESCITNDAYEQYRVAVNNNIPVLVWRHEIPLREIKNISDEKYKKLLRGAKGGRIEQFISTVIHKVQAMDEKS